jgi:hypothetical protein
MNRENELNETVTLNKYQLRIMLRQAFRQGKNWAKIPEWYNDEDKYIEQVFKSLPETEEQVKPQTA